ncbi:MauE/DoxX family redox-associated membrane protein [Thermocoleostomius sinensis]|uniref:MauE/DoxX family redox-associated membrane protein n=1 Tax=Thermocoleostomius sinensis TaxID=3065396 RepID=UPI0036F4183F
MYYSYLFIFCRTLVFSVFTASCFFKVKNFSRFVLTIHRFEILPSSIVKITGISIVGLELLVIGFLFSHSLIAFGLATVLLILFTLALISSLWRNLKIQCNCFGTSQHPISSIDLVRNAIFLVCSSVGGWLALQPHMQVKLSFVDSVSASFIALIFTLVLSNLSELYYLYDPAKVRS